MSSKSTEENKYDTRKVFAWTTQKSWEASPALVLLRGLLALLHGILLCICCYSLWWGTDRLVAAWQDSETAATDRTSVFILVGLLSLLYLLMGQFSTYLDSLSRHKMTLLLQNESIRQAIELDLADIESAGKTDLLQKRRGLEHTACGVMDSLYAAIAVTVQFIGVMIICTIIGWPAFCAIAILVAVTVARIVPHFRRDDFEDKEWRESFGRLFYIEHLLSHESSAKEVRLFGLGSLFVPEFRRLAAKFAKRQTSTLRQTIRATCYSALQYCTIIAFSYWMIGQSVRGDLSPGLTVMAIVVMLLANSVWERSTRLFYVLRRSANGIKAYEEGMAMHPTIKSTPESLPVPEKEDLKIAFEGVSLTYLDEKHPALQDISLTINPGDRIALVGENGSGKTTFVKLLTRLYDPSSGCITLDGKDLKSYNVDEYRRRFGVIFQDFMRYHGSVIENIGYAQHERMNDRDAIEQAIGKVGAEDVIEGLPDGYDTKLGSWFEKGTDLSDGQWQKLALARAFFRECDILVLDEPTSVIDARMEHQIFKRFMEITEGKTTVMISHRFSTVRMVDKIYVFKQGRIVEHGSHSSLMAEDGLYAELFTMQAEGYVQAGERDITAQQSS